MASDQARREPVAKESVVILEKDRVPKMATQNPDIVHEGAREGHEELPPSHLFQKVGGLEYSSAPNVISETEKMRQLGIEERPGGVKFDVYGDDGGAGREMHGGVGAGGGREGLSLEEMSKYRQQAQQNSADALMAAEQRYAKAKQSGATGGQARGTMDHDRPGEQSQYTMTQGMENIPGYVSQKAGDMKDTTLETGQKGYEATKDTLSSAGKTAADYAVPVKDYTLQKAAEAKNVLSSTGQSAAQLMSQKAAGAKDTAIDTGSTAASYLQEKAIAAKDVTIESGKGAANYAGKVAEDVAERAKVAGWGAAHYTMEKTVDATKGLANVTSSAAGYAGEKAVQAKDVVAGTGQKAVNYAGEKLVAAKDVIVSKEESAAEYAARKQAEAQREYEMKKQSQAKGERAIPAMSETLQQEGTQQHGWGPQQPSDQPQEGAMLVGHTETITRPAGHVEHGSTKKVEKNSGGDGGSVLGAVGETIAEIGETTKELLIGKSKP